MNEQAISLLQQILEQQQKQTTLLEQIVGTQAALIAALAEDQGLDPDDRPMTYLDGSPCR